jgi:hypothetical protein
MNKYEVSGIPAAALLSELNIPFVVPLQHFESSIFKLHTNSGNVASAFNIGRSTSRRFGSPIEA